MLFHALMYTLVGLAIVSILAPGNATHIEGFQLYLEIIIVCFLVDVAFHLRLLVSRSSLKEADDGTTD